MRVLLSSRSDLCCVVWSGPLTSADLMGVSGEGLKVAYQVLDEMRVFYAVPFRISLRAAVAGCAWVTVFLSVHLNVVLF